MPLPTTTDDLLDWRAITSGEIIKRATIAIIYDLEKKPTPPIGTGRLN
jgi:hypothetical protein